MRKPISKHPKTIFPNTTIIRKEIDPMALGVAVTTPIAQTLLSRLSGPLDQASNLGLGLSMTSLARAVGPLAGGFFFQHLGTPYPFWAAAVLLVGAAGLVAAVPAGDRRGHVPEGIGADGRPSRASREDEIATSSGLGR
jgi:MFS family permease